MRTATSFPSRRIPLDYTHGRDHDGVRPWPYGDLERGWPGEPFVVVATPPFARSGAILAHLLGDPRTGLRRAELIVQWELAAKHAAVWPATERSTYWRAWFDVSIARRLERSAF